MPVAIRRWEKWTPSRIGWFVAGALALALGAVGAALPVLPTTPFVILAAFCFGKSAPSFQRKLEQSRTFGPMIADWHRHGVIAPQYKAIALMAMGVALGASIVLGASITVVAIQAVCMAAAAAFILSRPDRARQDEHHDASRQRGKDMS